MTRVGFAAPQQKKKKKNLKRNYTIIINRHQSDPHRPVSASSKISSKVLQAVFHHLVFNSTLFLT